MQEGYARIGTTYFDRVRPELSPEYIQLDERGLPELLHAFLNVSGQIPYSDSTSWRSFFEFDPLFLLSEIIALDTEEIILKYQVLLRKLDYAYGDGYEWEMAKGEISKFLFSIFHDLDRWLRESRFDQSLYHFENITGVLAAYQKEFSDLYQSLCEVLGEEDPRITKHWGLESKEYPEWSEMDESGSPHQYLDRPFYKIIDAFRRLQARCQALQDESLLHQPYHEPHVALAVAFMRLYQLVQQDVNQFTEEFLDYYYRNTLHQENHIAKGDEVYLAFRLGAHKRIHTLLPGTEVSAGLDGEGRDILYANEQEVALTQAKVVSMRSLLLYRDSNIELFEGSRHLFISGLFKHAFASQHRDGYGLFFGRQPVAAFGETSAVSSTGESVDESSDVGLYIESPYLVLQEGIRHVSLVLVCDLDSLQPLLEILSPGDQASIGGEKRSSETVDIVDEINTRFIKIFRETLEIELSTAEGWLTVGNYEVMPPENWTTGEIPIHFELGRSQPAIELLAGDTLPFTPKWPVARITLTRRKNIYAYTLLKDIRLREIRIETRVSGVKDLQLYNDIGQIDAGSPFNPFGPTPQKGNTLMVGYRELFLRRLNSLQLTVDWQGLPETENGFKDYYEGYGSEIANSSFQVSVAGLRNYKFEPDLDARQVLPLFQDRDGVLSSTTVISDIDLERLGLKPEFSLSEPPTFDNKTKAGFLRFELVNPSMGFGFKLYPKLFAQAVIKQSKDKKGEETAIPNEPYIPMIRSVALDYQATGTLVLDKSRLRENDPTAGHRIYHIHPFGVQKVFDIEHCHSDYLLPHYDHDGHLLIELKDVAAGQPLTLFFDLQESVQEASVDRLPEISWHYLQADRWVEFEPKNVQDYTFQFTATGIVNFRLPEEISLDHSQLPAGSFWIGVFARGDVGLLSRVRGMYSNVAKFQWRPNAPDVEWTDHIDARKINSFIVSDTAVDGIHQPFRSFGGLRREEDADMRARVSELLRHKGRISAAWDIEHLLLEEFDFLYQVKVIRAHKEFGKEVEAPVVVVAKKFSTQGELYRPTLNYKRLDDIAAFLAERSSAFAEFRVLNPSFPTTRIRCTVKFIRDSEDYIHELNRAINRFLCPWFYEEDRPLQLGRVFEFDELKDMILALDFVEFVTRLSFTILHTDEKGFSSLLDSAEMSHSQISENLSGWSVLYPAREHDIEISNEENYIPARLSRIETLAIGEDFVIAEEHESEKTVGEGGRASQYMIFNIKTE